MYNVATTSPRFLIKQALEGNLDDIEVARGYCARTKVTFRCIYNAQAKLFIMGPEPHHDPNYQYPERANDRLKIIKIDASKKSQWLIEDNVVLKWTDIVTANFLVREGACDYAAFDLVQRMVLNDKDDYYKVWRVASTPEFKGENLMLEYSANEKQFTLTGMDTKRIYVRKKLGYHRNILKPISEFFALLAEHHITYS